MSESSHDFWSKIKRESTEFTHSSKEIKNVILIISLIMLAITIILSLFSAKRITNPIKKSAKYLKMIANGDFSFSIDSKILRKKR